MFLTHPKPSDDEQAALWKRLIDGTLATPDTWEVILAAAGAKGQSKTDAWEQVLDLWIREADNTGPADGLKISNHFAIIRNLRNIVQAGVSDRHLEKLRRALASPQWARGARRILPFRYVAAARACPQFEPALDQALAASLAELPGFDGETLVLVDVSGSMDWKLSAKSDLSRLDAAAALASIVRSDRLRVFTFSQHVVEVPPRRGMAGVDAVIRSQHHGGTYLGAAVTQLNAIHYRRLIVVTDEQSHDPVPGPRPGGLGYMINVGSDQNGVGYRDGWNTITGFSENVLRYIHEVESTAAEEKPPGGSENEESTKSKGPAWSASTVPFGDTFSE